MEFSESNMAFQALEVRIAGWMINLDVEDVHRHKKGPGLRSVGL